MGRGGVGRVITGRDVVVNDFTIGSRHALMMVLSSYVYYPVIYASHIHIWILRSIILKTEKMSHYFRLLHSGDGSPFLM